MRLVLSRKGFDAQYGGVPSPILPDGRLFSLPIPSPLAADRLGALAIDGIDLGQLAADLTDNRLGAMTTIHRDPDLYGPALPRPQGWRPAFGQVATAQAHLRKQGIGVGDLFLFFGWFRQVDRHHGRWRYVPGSPDIHALFGWLQVGEVIPVSKDTQPIVACHTWLRDHPHIAGAERFGSNNTIYVAAPTLQLPGRSAGRPGGGFFDCFSPALQLTAQGRTRSWWHLPPWFAPVAGRPCLSYHRNPTRWTPQGDTVLLQTVAKGQEFVIDRGNDPEVSDWVNSLFSSSDSLQSLATT